MTDIILTQKDILIPALKKKWMSNYEIQRYVDSSSGDRVMRYIRSNPPLGYTIMKRQKDVPEGYNRCYEYRLVRVGDGNQRP